MKKVIGLLVAIGILWARGYDTNMGKVVRLGVKSNNAYACKSSMEDWETIMSEDFESGTLPEGWVTIDGNGDGFTWQVGFCSDPSTPPNYGTSYLYFSDDDAGSGVSSNDSVITIAYPISDYDDLRFIYSYAFDTWGSNPQHGVVIVRFFANGEWCDWELLRDYSEDEEGWDTLQLGSYLPADSVQIGFVYWDEDAWGWGFYVDNFALEGLVELHHDVAVVGIQPSGSGIPDEANVVVTIANIGDYDEVFPVHVDIAGPVNGSFDTTVALASGEEMDVDFGTFNFDTEGVYTITAFTSLELDEFPQNDTVSIQYTATWWLAYDDGVAISSLSYDEGCNYWGWGMRFDIPIEGYIDTVFVGLSNYPDPGERPLRLVIYNDNDRTPGDPIWQCDTSLDAAIWPSWTGHFIFTHEIPVTPGAYYYFWLDAVGGDGQCLCTDAELSMPEGYYWGDTGAFYIDVEDHGDWFLRIHLTTELGVGEWIPSDPHKEVFMSIAPVVAGRGCVTIRLSALDRHNVKVSVYDVAGRLVEELFSGELEGSKVIKWNIDDVSSGIYFVKLTAGNKEISRKVAVIK